ncbi:hypothetical protein KBI23_08230 [bacterium]|nr:hypothetical protein [bacterium]MBP9808406.1 hypothetical protein [bacterium]
MSVKMRKYLSLASFFSSALMVPLVGLYTAPQAYGLDHPFAGDGEKPAAAAPAVSLAAANLVQLASDYRANADELSWARYATYLRDLLALPQFASADPAQIIAANPSLSEFKVKVSETGIGNFRVWSFPRIVESHSVIFQTPARTTAVPLPQAVAFREARIVGGFVPPLAAVVPSVRAVKSAKGTAVHKLTAYKQVAHPVAHTQVASGPKSLVLIGADRSSGTLWFKGFQLVEGMPEATELFSSLPAFFTQNVTGKATFSGNDIVLTIQPPVVRKEKVEEEKPAGVVKDTVSKPVAATSVPGYKVVLKFVSGKYTLAGHVPDDAPFSVALSFAQAVAGAKPELAKSWLVDSKLVSIPKYLGLFGRVSPPMRLLPMSNAAGASRYRLVTSAKDDLIIEVGRILQPGRLKGQLAIRALFVAPSDAIAQRLSGAMVMPSGSAPASAASAKPISVSPPAMRKN